MRYTQGGKIYFFIFSIVTFLFVAGIFLLPQTPLQAAEITSGSVAGGINNERNKLELPPLSEHALLTAAAVAKAQAILAQGSFAHNIADKTFSEWVTEAGYRYHVVGENLAIHFSDTEPLFNAWLASPTHKQNILHTEYTEVGIAIVTGSWHDEPTTIVVTIFGQPADMSELFVPLTAGISSESIAPLLTSNLAENYLENIAYTQPAITHSYGEPFTFTSSLAQNKTAILSYVGIAAHVMTLFITMMLSVVAIYYYTTYFMTLARRLQQIQKQQYGS